MRFLNLVVLIVPLAVGSSAPEDPAGEFLKHLETVHPASTGTRIEFTGDYLQLPVGLKQNLITQFPDLNIRIAKMKYLHWGMDPVNLMIFQAKGSGEVVTYLWDIWFTPAPFSFENVVGTHIEISPDRRTSFTSIARLIAFSMHGSVGHVEESEDKYTTAIADSHDRPWRMLNYSAKPQGTG